MAELAAMRARNDVNQEDFEAAREILRQRYGVSDQERPVPSAMRARKNGQFSSQMQPIAFRTSQSSTETAKHLKTQTISDKTAQGLVSVMVVLMFAAVVAFKGCASDSSGTISSAPAEDYKNGFHSCQAGTGQTEISLQESQKRCEIPTLFNT